MSTAFPSQENDPFCQKGASSSTDVDDPSDRTNSELNVKSMQAPRWQIETHEETVERQNTIRAFEARLAQVKQQQGTYLAQASPHMEIMPDSSYEEEEEDERMSDDEAEEGLHLLWKDREGLEQGMRQPRSEWKYA
ncbi:hypothetical protein DFQ29_005191 [Apophysomyces sp. BC1021]|nr:hypothetical protein DFQ29_005191 [Apophysomyces sp. BC1021]